MQWTVLAEVKLWLMVHTPLTSFRQVLLIFDGTVETLPPQKIPSSCAECPRLGSGRCGNVQEVFEVKSYNSVFRIVAPPDSPPVINRPE